MPSANAKAWEESAVLQLKQQIARLDPAERAQLPFAVPVNMTAVFYRARNVGDMGNYVNAACDALEKAGIVANDKWILGFDYSRLRVDKNHARTELDVTLLVE